MLVSKIKSIEIESLINIDLSVGINMDFELVFEFLLILRLLGEYKFIKL
jgi:hypothetical protein